MSTCPLCQQSIAAPSLSDAITTFGLNGHEATILETIWQGKGYPVRTERVFDAMYADDPDGGPAQAKMYRTFYRALERLRKKLRKSNIAIEPAGYRRGYRLSLG